MDTHKTPRKTMMVPVKAFRDLQECQNLLEKKAGYTGVKKNQAFSMIMQNVKNALKSKTREKLKSGVLTWTIDQVWATCKIE